MYMYIGFLELINNMLTSGMVPALFPDDEKEAIIGQVHTHMYIRTKLYLNNACKQFNKYMYVVRIDREGSNGPMYICVHNTHVHIICDVGKHV